jgi:4-methyl-5(b-hydroxyethyl)-thiazole monophosphate biosynthesis
MRKKVLLPIADGCEEIESIGAVDVLRRAGAEVTIAAIKNLQITASRDTKIVADKLLTECVNETYDLIVLPGGMPGAEHLRDNEQLTAMLKEQQQANRLYAAICASPVVILQQHGLLSGKKATAHPALIDQLQNQENARVVVDQNCITSQGPGTTLEFALKLTELLFDKTKANQVAEAMVCA